MSKDDRKTRREAGKANPGPKPELLKVEGNWEDAVKKMNYPAASYGVSKAFYNEYAIVASYGELTPNEIKEETTI
jgi:hypothetical protein